MSEEEWDRERGAKVKREKDGVKACPTKAN
jgi:hypothetical protein